MAKVVITDKQYNALCYVLDLVSHNIGATGNDELDKAHNKEIEHVCNILENYRQADLKEAMKITKIRKKYAV